MACSSKISTLHPVRQQAIAKGINTICDFCTHSFYTKDIESGKTKFNKCLLDPNINIESIDCSQFDLDLYIIDDEERTFYEEKGICWG